MHDILPGTSIPRAYTYSWNDEIVAQNLFAGVLTDSARAVVSGLDTRAEGVPLVVWNPLATAREDLVEAEVRFARRAPRRIVVRDRHGRDLPAQVLGRSGRTARILFRAEVPATSLTVYDVRPDAARRGDRRGPTAAGRVVENEHYRVTLDEAGDVRSILDRRAGDRELLRAPARLVFTGERPRHYPAWNMDWADRQREPLGFVDGPAQIRVVENGPVRAAIEVRRSSRDSTVVQRIRLAAGDAGRRVEFDTFIDWQSAGTALRAAFPLTVANPVATYNWGLGTIERGNNDPKKYEVPSHEWFDLTGTSNTYGVSILEDSKFGSDKPDDSTLRLTLLYSPGVRNSFLDQHSQDWGRHRMLYGLYAHDGDWRDGLSEWQGRRINQPLAAFQARSHPGELGRSFSWLSVSTPQVDARALKRAERGPHHIVRLQELWGRPAEGVEVSLGAGIAEAWEVDGQERRIGTAGLENGRLIVDFTPYAPRTFAVRLAAAPIALAAPRHRTVSLPFDTDGISRDANRGDGALDADGRTLPAEMLPGSVETAGVVFEPAAVGDGEPNAVSCRGQQIPLPAGRWDRVELLAAATEDVPRAVFTVGRLKQRRSVQAWTGFVGQWDDRLWDRELPEVDYKGEGRVVGFAPGFVKRDPIAWFATHRHHPRAGNEAYRFSYLFRYSLDVPPGATTLTLPDDPRVKLFAATVVRGGGDAVRPATPLHDDLSGHGPLRLRHVYPPPPKPVFAGIEPAGRFTSERAEAFDQLAMGPPVDDDAATGREFRYHQRDGDWSPHWGSAPVDGTFPRLNDGAVARNDDDTSACVWYDNEGRFSLDLGRPTEIDRVNTYSWHRLDRAPQWFSIWGSNDEVMPDPGLAHDAHEGWTLLAVVDTRELGHGGVHGSSVTGRDGEALGRWRHLLWVAPNVGNGTFFTEIDVHATD